MNLSMGCIVPYLLCDYCSEQYVNIEDTTSICSGCGGNSFTVINSRKDHMNSCIRNIKIGDSVVLRLLPYNDRYKTFEDPVTLSVIGFDNKTIPIVGTMSKELYENHRFITTSAFYGSDEMRKWKYCIALDQEDILIERVIKGSPPPVWRVGKSLGRTLYMDDRCVGMVDSKEIAELIVAAMNK